MSRNPALHVTRVSENVHHVRAGTVNWVLLSEGTDLTLIDGGYPAHGDAVEESIRGLGRRPEDVAAVLVTHAHVDHIGSLGRFVARYGVPVHMNAREVAHARRDLLQQATPKDILSQAWRPRVLPWALHIIRSGALGDVALDAATPFPNDGALDVPGRPVPVATPGHTSGHSTYHLPEHGVLVSGDALVTAHPLSRVHGPQPLPSMFHHDRVEADDALDRLVDLDADALLPGHGPVWRGGMREAVATARENAARVW
ncbi:MBL fold metallo-hydrolase [Nocardiopsis sp. MG754419]|uniref:MBL fold metallo-hydrolase n=1 Tax=Nocardiopsis sp. MG754419 TaxID=2259865 RepID=UPI001BA69ABD|nr:MBL fold metallo-hydrolase [Nocardiopsis sp. MG754419]MBR8740824.1 MBL fold metallo-hydrolase [Nocardiopsis sp. MG754419]